MKFKIVHKNGKEKIISAKNLDDAEIKANKIWKNWEEIKIINWRKYLYEKENEKICPRSLEKKSQ